MKQALKLLRKPRQVDPEQERETLRRADEAEALLRNDAFREALEDIEAVYMTAWRQSDSLDVERRERAHVAVCLLDDLRNILIDHVRTGAAARDRIERSLRPQ